MGKYIKDYVALVEKILSENNKDYDYKKLKVEFLIKIEFFQHERLVHFLVTFMCVIILFISILFIFNGGGVGMVALAIILLGLVAAYLAYYYFIENIVQKMYKIYDRINEKIKEQESNREIN